MRDSTGAQGRDFWGDGVSAIAKLLNSLALHSHRSRSFVRVAYNVVSGVHVMTDTSYGRSTSTVCVSSSNEALLPSCMQTPQHSSWAVSRCHYLAPCQECDENSSCMMQEAGKHPVCPRGILRSRSSFLPFIDSADSRTYLLYDITKHRHHFCSLRRTSIHPVGYREQ